MKLKALFVISAFLMILSSCSETQQQYNYQYLSPYQVGNTLETLETASGVQMFILNKGEGKKASKFDRVTISVSFEGFKTPDKSVYAPQYRINAATTSFRVGIDLPYVQGIEDGVQQLSMGAKARFIIPSPLAFGAYGATIDGISGKYPFASYLADVELTNLETGIKIEPYEPKNIDTVKLASGLKYLKCVVAPNNATQAMDKSTVLVNYTGFLKNGDIFDSTIPENKPFSFQIGVSDVIKGWHEALKEMKVGDKFRFFIPSDLAYGNNPNGKIKSFSDLIFDIELLSVK